jgi:hypothetical protein
MKNGGGVASESNDENMRSQQQPSVAKERRSGAGARHFFFSPTWII